jgi:hypothetical protein
VTPLSTHVFLIVVPALIIVGSVAWYVIGSRRER